ncbi:hypothetical protein AS594_40035 [Streptomyces agglomeratus]|uniref:OmpR/PhoB-type domain-containing protein n=1 Tax=Streptomyces agglomeratus TaxID=285458 RepID=A0A1E5NXJ0_9ACTN|nr:AfsR/SARP family transcriptional regulator [Streptomyces agglomeratus]OEJ20978.1 hypothetical protein AS594_40035 [Streptomyces agglomeratus]
MIELGVLGELTVRVDRLEVGLKAPMVRRLLAVLLTRAGHPVPVSTLIDALWQGERPQNSHKTLQVYILRLRQALGDAMRIRRHAGGYAVVVGPGELDAQRFEDLVAQGRHARHAGEPEQASQLFTGALSLWRGAPYADVAEAGLVDEEVRRLEEARLALQEERIGVDLELGWHSGLVPELDALVAAHPYREELRAQLMLALYRTGRRREALEVYRSTRRMLREELGIEPRPGLLALHERILRADPGLEPRPAVLPSGPAVAGRPGRPPSRQFLKTMESVGGRASHVACLTPCHRNRVRPPEV